MQSSTQIPCSFIELGTYSRDYVPPKPPTPEQQKEWRARANKRDHPVRTRILEWLAKLTTETK